MSHTDELRLMRYKIDPVALFVDTVGMIDQWQVQRLRYPKRRALLLCPRQSGKSSVEGCHSAYRMLRNSNENIVCVAPSLRQAKVILRHTKQFLRTARQRFIIDSAHEVQIESGARFQAIPQTSIRGEFRVTKIIIDEAAEVADNVAPTLEPMLIDGGTFVKLTTPQGRIGDFYECFQNGPTLEEDVYNGWEKIKITALDIPRKYSDAFIQAKLRDVSFGPYWVKQELMCEFLDVADAIFTRSDYDSSLDDGIEPIYL